MITQQALAAVDGHWAVQAAGIAQRNRALQVADALLVKQAVGDQITIDFAEEAADQETLERVMEAYLLAGVEGLQALLRPTTENQALQEQAMAASWRVFELKRQTAIPAEPSARIMHILSLSAFAYCGDRWQDLRRWYQAHKQDVVPPAVADAPWDRHLLFKLYDCWKRLFHKQGWEDLNGVRTIINDLRKSQEVYEAELLNSNSEALAQKQATALRLVALYHWAKATELLSTYMLQGEPITIRTELDQHFEQAIEASSHAQDMGLELLLRWLFVGSHQMVQGSIWWATRTVNSRVTQFVNAATKQHGLFELLPPQRAALLEQGLLDIAQTAVVIDLPTSGGKTLLAEFRILQALNQFDADGGWVAYVAPTKGIDGTDYPPPEERFFSYRHSGRATFWRGGNRCL